MKIKWRVAAAPTGRYRSFDKRGWPMAETADKGEPVFRLDCADAYVPRLVREGKHAEIEIRVRCGRKETDGWQWKRLVKRAATLDEAKAIVAPVYRAEP